jgi:multidrug transporter EmrE-like cation transporter
LNISNIISDYIICNDYFKYLCYYCAIYQSVCNSTLLKSHETFSRACNLRLVFFVAQIFIFFLCFCCFILIIHTKESFCLSFSCFSTSTNRKMATSTSIITNNDVPSNCHTVTICVDLSTSEKYYNIEKIKDFSPTDY